jgi:glutathione S-transferase
MLSLQSEHGWVIVVVLGTVFLNLSLQFKVGAARKKYNIAYPTLYAPETCKDAKAFNCIQRAHQNIATERLPSFYALLFCSALSRPTVAAALGALRLVGYFAYARGYSSGSPEKRNNVLSMVGYLGDLGMLGLAIENAVTLLM